MQTGQKFLKLNGMSARDGIAEQMRWQPARGCQGKPMCRKIADLLRPPNGGHGGQPGQGFISNSFTDSLFYSLCFPFSQFGDQSLTRLTTLTGMVKVREIVELEVRSLCEATLTISLTGMVGRRFCPRYSRSVAVSQP